MLKNFIIILCLIFSQISQSSEWIDFEWSQEKISGKLYNKAGMMIRVDKNKLLQLDSGSTKSYLYSPEYNFPEEKEISFQLTGGKTLLHSYSVHKTMKSGMEKTNAISEANNIGTLGADYFKDSLLIIDFPNQKFIKSNSLNLINISINNVTWLEGEVTDYLHISTTVTVGDVQFNPVLFDTGSSIFTLILNKNLWETVVSNKDAQYPPLKLEVSAWGNMIPLYGARSIKPVCIGSICKESDIYFTDDLRMDLSKQGLSGLVGNAILRDEYILILDYKNKRIGTIKG